MEEYDTNKVNVYFAGDIWQIEDGMGNCIYLDSTELDKVLKLIDAHKTIFKEKSV